MQAKESNMQASWRTPGLVLLAGCLIAASGFGLRSVFGLFTEPLSEAHNWGRDVFGLAIALQNLLWGAAQPFAGALADRYGAARVLAAGGVLYAIGVALMALTESPTGIVLSGGVLVGLGLAGSSFTIVIASFARLMPEEKRSWALGLAPAAGSLGQFLFAPAGQAFISAWGWQTALLLLSTSVLLVPLLAPVLAGKSSGRGGLSEVDMSLGQAVRGAFGHAGYRYLVAGFFVCGFHIAFITTHLPAWLSDQGISSSVAGWAIALIGLFNIVGSYMSGVLGGRRSRRNMLSVIYLARSVAIALLILLPVSDLSVLLFAAVIGLLWLSTVPPTSGLVALMFGTRYMATLFGIVFFSHQVGAALAVWLGGVLYESQGSYDMVWWLSIGLGVLAAAVHWPIREQQAPGFFEPEPARG